MGKLPEEMTKGELLVELLHKGQADLARSTAITDMESRISLLEQALKECLGAAESLETAPPEMHSLHIMRVKAAYNMAFPEESEEV